MMNQNWLLRVAAVLMLATSSTIVFAQDEDAGEDASKDKQSPSLSVMVIDGEGTILDGGGVLDGLPEGILQQVKQLRMQLGQSPAGGIEVKVDGLDAAEPGDQPDSAAGGVKLSVSSKGTVVVVGPDGKTTRREFSFGNKGGGANGDEVDLLGTIMTEVLDGEHGLPIDTVRRVTQFLKRPRQARKVQETASKQDSIMKKLDSILGRLDRLESEIAELKNAN